MSVKLLACILAVSVCACALLAEDAPNKKVADFLGAGAVDVLKAADKVECLRIDPIGRPAEDAKTFNGYKILAKGADQKADFAKRIASILFNEKTYNFEMAKLCEFMPGVAFRLWKEKEYVDVLLCFSCDELEVISPGSPAHRVHQNMDAAHAALLKIAMDAFPDDAELKKLAAKRAD